MNQCIGVLTVFFDEPFWVGVYERTENGKLEVCRVVFGAEPKDYTVYEYFLTNYTKLRFSPPVEMSDKNYAHSNPKRAQRAIGKRLMQQGVGTKAQQAIKLQQEQGKLERKASQKQRSEEEKQRRFDLRQEKKHKKHRGR